MRAACLLALIALGGCAAGPETRSGRPEIALRGTRDEIREELVSAFVPQGWTVGRSDASTVVFARPSDSAAATVLLGSAYDPTVWIRVTFVLTGSTGVVNVYGRVEFVTNYGSAFERLTDASSGKAGSDVQRVLDRIQARRGGPTQMEGVSRAVAPDPGESRPADWRGAAVRAGPE